MENDIPEIYLAKLSTFVAETLGLHFPAERWPDLQRGAVAAAHTLGFEGQPSLCGQWLLEQALSRRQIEQLASHLTVGETYFFRDRRQFNFLAEHILPPLIQQRRGKEQRLRIWSAACCTGEEAYSIAILLQSVLADWEDWNITLLATDINPHSLRKAEAGIFGQWSFRDTPATFRSTYFRTKSEGQYEILPDIKKMVHFMQLNLAEDAYPSLSNDTNAMDVIFCRNVLMYFTTQHAQRVIEKLHRTQVEGGWLMVSPSELLNVSSSPYMIVNSQGCFMHRKQGGLVPSLKSVGFAATPMPASPHWHPTYPPVFGPTASTAPQMAPAPEGQLLVSEETSADILAGAEALYANGRYDEAIARLQELKTEDTEIPGRFSLLVHALANQGRLAEALACCNQWIAANKLHAPAHYLRATVLQEQGEIEQAVQSLRKALYLDNNLALAHFALGNISRGRRRTSETARHFGNTLQLLGTYRPEHILADSGGLTAERLAEIVTSLLELEDSP